MPNDNFFDSFESSSEEPTNILDSMAPGVPADRTPVATLRNKAAAIAMLKGGNSVQTYRDVVQQAESGKPLNQTQAAQDISTGLDNMDTQGIMSVLSDPTVSMETKKAAIRGVKAPSPLREHTGLVMSQALAADSGDETEQEEAARTSIIDNMTDALVQRQKQQEIINKFVIGRDTDYNKALREAIKGELTPGFASEVAARMDEGSIWEKTKAALFPGTTMRKTQEQLLELSPREATAKVLDIVNKLKGLDGILINDDDTYNKLQYLQNIAEGDVMGGVEETLMNLDPWLSIIGLKAARTAAGRIALRMKTQGEALEDAKKVVTSVGTASEIKTPVGPSKGLPETALAKAPVPDQAIAAKAKQIAKLEEEKAGLLGDVNLAGKGDVRNIKAELDALKKPDTNAKELADTLKKGNPRLSAKDARAEAAKRVDEEMADYLAKRDRLEGMLKTNSASGTTEQRIAALEKEIASLSKGMPAQAGSVENKVLSVLKSIEWNQTARMDLPGAVANVVGAANPSMARGMFASVVRAPDDTAARALYGTTKEEAVVANLAPQIVAPDGSVVSKVTQIDRELKAPDAIKEFVSGGEGLEFKNKELESAFKFAKERFNNGPGLVANEAMGGIRTSENGDVISFDAVFGSKEGGFPTAKEAIEQAKYSLQKFGVTDDQVEVLVSDGVSHRPTTLAEAGDKPGNYFVRVKTDYQVNMHDVGSIEWVDTKWNALDALPGTLWADAGQASRWVMDAASMMHPVYTGAAVRAEDVGSRIAKELLVEAKEFTDKMDKLPKHRQSAVNEYLQAQNLAGKADDPVHLAANFHQDEISAIKSFRKFWDTHFYLENRSVAIGARNEGWEVLDNANTFQIAKRLHENFKGTVAKAYDPASGKIVRLTEKEAKDLYDANGFYSKLRRPQTFNGETVEHMIVRNTPQEYLRRINDGDQLLNKRPGYYQLNYKAAKFVDVVTKDAKGGVLTRKTVAVAGDTGEATAWTKRQTLQPGEEWDIRNDVKGMQAGSDEWFDVNQAGGRMATRHRGQPLDVGSGTNHIGTSDYILNPVDSSVRAARSVGQHVAMNSVLANMKERFKNQYWKFLEDDGMGGKKFPSSFSKLGAKGDRSSELTDARTVFGYIKYLEDGYLNGMDNVVKMVMGKAADMAASKGFYKTERVLNKGQEGSVGGLLKGAVFKSTIAAHPVRQALIQMHQSVRLASYLATINPVSTAKAYKNTIGHIMGMTRDLMKGVPNAFNDFVDESGMLDAVTQHSLIRSVTENYIDHSSKVLRKMSTPIDVAQKVGFVAGEQASAIAHLAAVYEKYTAKGLNLADKRVRAKAYSEARAIMGDMNKAGDMPYNQNWASAVMQFMQVPHKMALQITNRRIPLKERAKLVAGDAIFWGVPTWMVQNAFTEEMVPDRDMRMKLIEGAESAAMNSMMHTLFKSEYNIDFSSFAPTDMSGWFSFFDSILAGGVDEVLTNSPSGRLLGTNGRIQHAFHMTGRYFKPFFDEDATPVEFITVATEVGKVFSGFNDFQKAMLIKEFGERRDASGKLIETGVPQYAAWFQFFGLGGQDTKWMYETLKTNSKIQQNQKDDLRKVYNETLKAYSAMSGRGPEDGRTFTAYTGALLSIYKDNPEAMRQIMDWARMDATDPKVKLYEKLARGAGVPDGGERRHMIETAPTLTPEQKDLLIKNQRSFSNIEEE